MTANERKRILKCYADALRTIELAHAAIGILEGMRCKTSECCVLKLRALASSNIPKLDKYAAMLTAAPKQESE